MNGAASADPAPSCCAAGRAELGAMDPTPTGADDASTRGLAALAAQATDVTSLPS